ncbi:carbonic anhydrase family protein [Helicobacter cynogastricus]|uniref:carbonic anhydrase family protein n=1 Tax=Helicobacter cynogastricus TaxID=329937 RepID=UPI000CF1AE2F|nr:carbonic anhydrase family protein [Helicobacter cynogastricus]
MKKLLLLCAFGISLGMGADSPHKWGYNSPSTPRQWGDLHKDFELCKSGKNQSPIDIEHYYYTPNKEDLAAVYQNKAKPTSLTYAHHTLVVQFNSAQNHILYRDHVYKLVNLHFHTPMEFSIHKHRQPLSMHMVHQDANGLLLVLGIGFEIGKPNEMITRLLEAYAHKQVPKSLDLENLLPASINYYHFNGSLTTPPCTEGVAWFIIEETLSVSKEQLAALQKIMHHVKNNRPPQKDYNSVIVKSSAVLREP